MDASGKYVPNTTIATDIDEYYRSHYGIDNAEGSTFSTDFIKLREARLDYTICPTLLKNWDCNGPRSVFTAATFYLVILAWI
jgi:hypothetical protein